MRHKDTKTQRHKDNICFKINLVLLVSWCLGVLATFAYASNPESLRRYFIQGDYKACIQEGEKILASAGKDGVKNDELYYLLGMSYLKEKDPLSASKNFKIILNEFRKSRFKEIAQVGLGDSYFMRGDYTLAAFQYQELIKSNPRTKLKPGIYYRLSQIGVKTGNKEQESDYLAKLKKEFPLSPEARENKELFPLHVQMQTDEKSVPLQPSLNYTVQVGAFSSEDNAKKLAAKLTGKGYTVFLAEAVSGSNRIFKVRVGNFKNQREAREAEKKLQKEGYPTKIIP